MADDILDNPFVEKIDIPAADEDLIRIYREIGRSVDDLAYTPDFENLYQQYLEAGHHAERHDVFRRLLVLRKSGLLPRLFRQAGEPAA